MSTTDKAFFDVSCDIKAFSLGWTTFRFGFDFRHPITSMLRTAKAIVNVLFDSITDQLGKRRKREISFLADRFKQEGINILKQYTILFKQQNSVIIASLKICFNLFPFISG
jgi:hypothetical protein